MAKTATRVRFEKAYKEARDSGDRTFDFEGKSYNTRMAGESASDYNKKMSSAGRTKARSEEDTAGGEEIRATARSRASTADSAPASASDTPETTSKPEEKNVVTDPKTGIVPRRYGTYRTGEGDTTESKPFFTLNSEMPQKRYGTVRTGEGDSPSDKESPNLVPDIYKEDRVRDVPAQQYRKGGIVKKKSGGSVRGAGIAQRGQGKIRMC